ncbi:hypothetical protein SPHINGO391_520099 [Sphingomonas aurantiaca]|uniref:Uncharacterized protein n=1 Tax=Sphingomonas aurantiaca TaxID=185949 RepID=A0A5E8AIX8_9SPHN|nr:hypothetical protein SPHINGO391_520099 [Sphingomonas aurantiaca]
MVADRLRQCARRALCPARRPARVDPRCARWRQAERGGARPRLLARHRRHPDRRRARACQQPGARQADRDAAPHTALERRRHRAGAPRERRVPVASRRPGREALRPGRERRTQRRHQDRGADLDADPRGRGRRRRLCRRRYRRARRAGDHQAWRRLDQRLRPRIEAAGATRAEREARPDRRAVGRHRLRRPPRTPLRTAQGADPRRPDLAIAAKLIPSFPPDRHPSERWDLPVRAAAPAHEYPGFRRDDGPGGAC